MQFMTLMSLKNIDNATKPEDWVIECRLHGTREGGSTRPRVTPDLTHYLTPCLALSRPDLWLF